MRMLAVFALVTGLVFAIQPDGHAADDLIAVEGGEFAIALPEGEGPFPAIFHLHGWGASAKAVMNNRGFVNGFLKRGYAVIAPQGLPRDGATQRNWTVIDGLSDMRDEAAFFAAVLDHAEAEGWIDRSRVMLTGFSRGGSMVWDIACTLARSVHRLCARRGGVLGADARGLYRSGGSLPHPWLGGPDRAARRAGAGERAPCPGGRLRVALHSPRDKWCDPAPVRRGAGGSGRGYLVAQLDRRERRADRPHAPPRCPWHTEGLERTGHLTGSKRGSAARAE